MLKKYDAKDVDAPSHCFGFPCPLALHIYSGEFSDQSINGYYISDHIRKSALLRLNYALAATILHIILSLLASLQYKSPTYRHSSRPLYLWSESWLTKSHDYLCTRWTFAFAGQSNDKYLITKYPDSLYEKCSPRVEVDVVNPPTKMTRAQMAGATCFSLHSSLKWTVGRPEFQLREFLKVVESFCSNNCTKYTAV